MRVKLGLAIAFGLVAAALTGGRLRPHPDPISVMFIPIDSTPPTDARLVLQHEGLLGWSTVAYFEGTTVSIADADCILGKRSFLLDSRTCYQRGDEEPAAESCVAPHVCRCTTVDGLRTCDATDPPVCSLPIGEACTKRVWSIGDGKLGLARP